MTPPVPACVAWIGAGTELFLDHLDIVEMPASSGLPGWTNGHVAAHIARNAEAVERLLEWARTGVETPMYASREARNADIERDAGRPAEVQRADVVATAQSLARTLGTLGTTAWSAALRNAQGGRISASDVPWMRVKEVWLHSVDIGASMEDLPAELADAVLVDVGAAFTAKPDAPGLHLTTTDSGLEVVIGDGASAVSGPAHSVLSWLTGRAEGHGLHCAGGLPQLPPWL